MPQIESHPEYPDLTHLSKCVKATRPISELIIKKPRLYSDGKKSDAAIAFEHVDHSTLNPITFTLTFCFRRTHFLILLLLAFVIFSLSLFLSIYHIFYVCIFVLKYLYLHYASSAFTYLFLKSNKSTSPRLLKPTSPLSPTLNLAPRNLISLSQSKGVFRSSVTKESWERKAARFLLQLYGADESVGRSLGRLKDAILVEKG